MKYFTNKIPLAFIYLLKTFGPTSGMNRYSLGGSGKIFSNL